MLHELYTVEFSKLIFGQHMARNFRIQHRSILLLLFPLILAVCMLGWIMCSQGSQKSGRDAMRTSIIKNGVEVLVTLREKDTELQS